MSVDDSRDEQWLSRPKCHRSMAPGNALCNECQTLANLDAGIELARGEHYAEALELFHRVCNMDVMEEGQDDECAKGFYYCGVCYAKMGNLDIAAGAWEECLRLEPGYEKAKIRLVELIGSKPKKKWSKKERAFMESSSMKDVKPLHKPEMSFEWVRWVLGFAVIVAALGAGWWFSAKSIRYFSYDRHIEAIELLLSTDQVAKSLQYYNDNFGSGEAAKYQQEAKADLAPFYKEAAMTKMIDGNTDAAIKLLTIASDFDPEDQDVKKKPQKLKVSTRGD